jgi:hypothetical protein
LTANLDTRFIGGGAFSIPGGRSPFLRTKAGGLHVGEGYRASQNPTQTGIVGNFLNGKTTLVLVAVIALLLVVKLK